MQNLTEYFTEIKRKKTGKSAMKRKQKKAEIREGQGYCCVRKLYALIWIEINMKMMLRTNIVETNQICDVEVLNLGQFTVIHEPCRAQILTDCLSTFQPRG
jgi:hypothetical protein